MATVKANMVGTLRCPDGKGREDYWLEGSVAGLSNLRLGVRVSRTGTKKWMARYCPAPLYLCHVFRDILRVCGGTGMARKRYSDEDVLNLLRQI